MIDWKVCETELEESIKKVLTWSHLIYLPTGVRGEGGVQIAGGFLRPRLFVCFCLLYIYI